METDLAAGKAVSRPLLAFPRAHVGSPPAHHWAPRALYRLLSVRNSAPPLAARGAFLRLHRGEAALDSGWTSGWALGVGIPRSRSMPCSNTLIGPRPRIGLQVTNIGQHVRIILLRLGYERSRLYLINGVAWAVSFFVVRILPSPYIFYKMVDCSYKDYSRTDFIIAWMTMPIPFVLNSFWFHLLASGVRARFLARPAPIEELLAEERPPARAKRR